MDVPGIRDRIRRDSTGTIPINRADLLDRVERWTQGRKISVCRGLCAKIVTTSEVMLAHGLAQEEIDSWMEAYERGNLEVLKVGYRRKRKARA